MRNLAHLPNGEVAEVAIPRIDLLISEWSIAGQALFVIVGTVRAL